MCVCMYMCIYICTPQIIKERWKGQFKPSNKWKLNIRLLPNFDNIQFSHPEWKYLVFALSSKKGLLGCWTEYTIKPLSGFFFLLKGSEIWSIEYAPRSITEWQPDLETAMEQNNPVLFYVSVCVCILQPCSFFHCLLTDQYGQWIVWLHLHCPIFS